MWVGPFYLRNELNDSNKTCCEANVTGDQVEAKSQKKKKKTYNQLTPK